MILDGSVVEATVFRNQQLAPSEGAYDGKNWQSLGVYSIGTSVIAVQLSNLANGVVVADGIIAVPELLPPPGGEGSSQLLALGNAPLPNIPPYDPVDINNDGIVSAIDALLVFNELNRGAKSELAAASFVGSALDVNADGYTTAIDALVVVNRLNADAARTSAPEEPADAVFSDLDASSSATDELFSLLADDVARRKRR
jgi:hypothetical protein